MQSRHEKSAVTEDEILYFAYGSNMSSHRLRARVPSAHKMINAVLTGHQLRFHKQSHVDGSAKCDAYQTGLADDRVMGVIFSFQHSEKPELDRVEGLGEGYEIKWVQVVTVDNQWVEAYTYVATDIDASLRPFDWYKAHVLAGAREQDLPAEYIAAIELVQAQADTNLNRAIRELAIYE